jgi:hypothetical protein
MIQIGEAYKKNLSGKIAPMIVPSHHWVRGEDEEPESAQAKIDKDL